MNSLYIIYAPPQAENPLLSIVLAFIEDQALAEAEMHKAYNKCFLRPEATHISFASKEELYQFALFLTQEYSVHEAILLSTQDFNMAIENVHNLANLQNLFQKFGQVISNPEINQKKKSFFTKMLSKK